MICVVIKGPSYEEAFSQIEKAQEIAHMVELRVDCFKDVDVERLRSSFYIPMLITNGDVILYEDKEIVSHHDFKETPKNLEEIYQNMQHKQADLYKMAFTANSTLDALRLMVFAKNKNVIAISMGPLGQFTRVLEKKITFAALDEESANAPGQLTASTLEEVYNYSRHSANTPIYGLIGDPVTLSISEHTHNRFFKDNEIDAVYIKMQVNKEELGEFLNLAKQLPIYGLSVTMPLKEAILPFLDEIDEEARQIGAVNTLQFKDGKIYGFNTDGKGALNAIEKHIQVDGKKLAIIGAGGSSKAIAFEAAKRGAEVKIYNRTTSSEIEGYDILINATPDPMPIEARFVLPGTIVMDIKTKPRETELLKIALEQGCRIVYGVEMFEEQAIGQFKIWFTSKSISTNLTLCV